MDATTGQNAFFQLRLFHEAVGLTGLVLTKLDGSARGGVVLGLAREFPVPVKLVGVGEKIEDLQTSTRMPSSRPSTPPPARGRPYRRPALRSDAPAWRLRRRIVFADDDADRNVFAMKVPGLLTLKESSSNSAIVPQLAPEPGELVVRKTVPSAFFATGLGPWLTQRGVRTLVVAGCVTSGCVRSSVVDAMSLGFLPLVVRDCVGDRAIGPHEANLFDMSERYAVVTDLSDTLKHLESKAAGSAVVTGGADIS